MCDQTKKSETAALRNVQEVSATPGPWRPVSPYIATNANTVIGRVMTAGDEDGPMRWQCESVADLENQANLKLLAAAPELANALKQMLSIVDMSGEPNEGGDSFILAFTDDEVLRRIKIGKEALAKAGIK